MNDQELRVHVQRGLESLRREFADRFTAERVTSIGNDRLEALIQDAKILEFIPLLVYRETREALLVSQPDALAPQAPDGLPPTWRERRWAPSPIRRTEALP